MGVGLGTSLERLVRRASRPAEGLARTATSQRAATKAVRAASMALDSLQLSSTVSLHSQAALERAAERHLLESKTRAAFETMTPDRARRLAAIKDPQMFFEGIKYLGPDQLKALAAYQPGVVELFGRQARARQQAWEELLDPMLSSHGLQVKGTPKSWSSMLGRLDQETRKLHAKGLPVHHAPIDLHDLSRARLDLDTFDPQAMTRMVGSIRRGLQEKFPARQFELSVWDRTAPGVLGNRAELYQGRIHLKIKDITGGVPQGMFELQIGPKQASAFWDTAFSVPGIDRRYNLHDAIYKGVANLKDERLIEKLGQAVAIAPHPGRQEAIAQGQHLIDDILNSYQDQLQAVLSQARTGRTLDYATTAGLRRKLGAVIQALSHDPALPEGLVGKALH